jgi:hypothetical protein
MDNWMAGTLEVQTHIDFKIRRIVETSSGIEIFARVHAGVYEQATDEEGVTFNRYARKKLLWEGSKKFPAGTPLKDILNDFNDRLQMMKGKLDIIPEQAVRDAVR